MDGEAIVGGEVQHLEVDDGLVELLTLKSGCHPFWGGSHPFWVDLATNCEGGDSTACVSLGLLFYAGDHVREDQGMACTLFRQACDNSNEVGCGECQLKCARQDRRQ